MRVKSRLHLLATVSIGTLVLLIGIAMSSMSQLAANQDEVFEKSQAQRVAAEAFWLGAQAYQIIADAIINRDLAQSRKGWADLLGEANGALDGLAAPADTGAERKDVAARRVEQIARMGEQNSAAVEETAVVASSLENLAGRLPTVAGGFRI